MLLALNNNSLDKFDKNIIFIFLSNFYKFVYRLFVDTVSNLLVRKRFKLHIIKLWILAYNMRVICFIKPFCKNHYWLWCVSLTSTIEDNVYPRHIHHCFLFHLNVSPICPYHSRVRSYIRNAILPYRRIYERYFVDSAQILNTFYIKLKI
jgi:hypothetical protein